MDKFYNNNCISAVNAWNKIQTAFGDVILNNLSTIKVKTLLTTKRIDKYSQISPT